MKNSFFIILFLLFFSLNSKAQNDSILGSQLTQNIFAHKFAEAEMFFDSSVKSKINKKVLEQVVMSLETSIGKYKKQLGFRQQTDSVYNFLFYYSEFEKTSLDLKYTFNKNHKAVGFFLVPHQEPEKLTPEINSADFTNTSFNINLKNIALPGTLTQPKTAIKNKKIVAIFVHGSGPQDRDETVGPNKPFKDLAEGLAKTGITTFRFEKRTKFAPNSLNLDKLTIDDEVTDDVVGMVHYFKNNDSLKNYKIIIIGHSLGAMMAPRIAEILRDTVAGIVMLAATARPLEDVMLEQIAYLQNHQPTNELKGYLADLKHRTEFLHSGEFDKDSPAASLPFNIPAAYWISLHTYNAVTTLKNSSTPTLILQGERDYQVTMTDFNIWKVATKEMKNVTLHSYPKLNHLFMEGSGDSTPAEYMTANNIPNYVIEQIAEWVLGIRY